MLEANLRKIGAVAMVAMALSLAGCQNAPAVSGGASGSAHGSAPEMKPYIQGPNSAPGVKGPTSAPK